MKLFGAALGAVLVAVGVALSALGWIAVTAYVLVVATVLGLGVRRQRAQQQESGRTCSCCTSTVFDEVKVV
jgi:hypothetical protein